MHKTHQDRIAAGRRAILDELGPSKAQIEHGLELHADAFVADVQGGVPVTLPVGIAMDRLQVDVDRLCRESTELGLTPDRANDWVKTQWRRLKTFESAFDPQWRELVRELYAIAGVNLASEDMSGPDENSLDAALEHIVRSNFVYEQTDEVVRVGRVSDIDRAHAAGKPAVLYHMAGVGGFAEAEEPIPRLDLFFGLGVRMMHLTYNRRNQLCSSWMQGDDDGGLTGVGWQAVQRMNALGVLVDIAHCGDRSALEVIEASDDPVLLSHTACRAVYDDVSNSTYVDAVMRQPYADGVARPTSPGSRNAGDDILRALGAHGGVAAFYTINYVIGQGDHADTFDCYAQHLEHAVDTAGVDHVAIGTDRTYFPQWPPTSMDWTNWPYWTVGLVCRGWSDDQIRRVIGANFLRVAQRVLDKQPWGCFI